jgi:hypothetical protein
MGENGKQKEEEIREHLKEMFPGTEFSIGPLNNYTLVEWNGAPEFKAVVMATRQFKNVLQNRIP